MLQPPQLNEVLVRYAAPIAELREFLAMTGLPLETPQVLGQIAARLRRDRGFHRDLTSNIWVLIDRCGRQVTYADLLGMLAIAAAGLRLASVADEDAAHDLLRFLMQARHALEDVAPTREPSPVATGPVRTVSPEDASGRGAYAATGAPHWIETAPAFAAAPAPTLPEERSVASTVVTKPTSDSLPPDPASPVPLAQPVARQPRPMPVAAPRKQEQRPEAEWTPPVDRRTLIDSEDNRRKRQTFAWSGAALCVLALAAGVWHFSGAGQPEHTAAPVVDNAPARYAAPNAGPAPDANVSGTTSSDSSARQSRSTERPSTYIAPEASYRSYAAGSGNTASPRTSNAPLAPSRGTPYVAAAPNANVASTPVAPAATPPVRAAGLGSTSVAPIARTGNKGPVLPTIVPNATLSRQLGSPSIPADSLAANDIAADGRKTPRLLRRKPSSQLTEYDEVADNRGPSTAGLPTGRGAGSRPAPQGIVRPTATGMMAGNVIYSPAPVYPAAAAAAHVQGEVKIQAQVDRNGNIAWARVVSGPPLLRDAALDAVQHWRYKPYTSGGKAIPASASAVVEFELP